MLNLDDLKKGDYFAIMGRFGILRFVAHFQGLLVFEESLYESALDAPIKLEVIRVYEDTKFYSVVEALEMEVNHG